MSEGEDVRVPVHVVAGDLEPSCGGGDESALRDETGAITELLGDCPDSVGMSAERIGDAVRDDSDVLGDEVARVSELAPQLTISHRPDATISRS